MKPSLAPMLLRAAFACALSTSLAAQTTAEADAPEQTGDGFRTLFRYERRSPEALPKPVNTVRAVFSDTSKPGTFIIVDPINHVKIQGVAGGEVLVSSTLALKNSGGGGTKTNDDTYLRVNSSFELIEEDNIISLGISGEGDNRFLQHDFQIQVPRNTSIVIENESTRHRRSVEIVDVDGDVSISLRDGDIVLKNTTAAISATASYGAIGVELGNAPGKPIILRGSKNIDFALPADAAANVRMRAIIGCIRTNFPEDVFKMTPASAPAARSPRRDTKADRERLDAIKAEIARRRQETGRVPSQAQTLDESDPERSSKRLDAIRAEIARRQQARGNDTTVPANANAIPNTGRSMGIIAGELNGGGVDISLTTSSGTITLRRAE